MKIKITKCEPLSEEEAKDMVGRARTIDDMPEDMRAELADNLDEYTIVIPEHVLEQMKEAGITPEEVSKMLKQSIRREQ